MITNRRNRTRVSENDNPATRPHRGAPPFLRRGECNVSGLERRVRSAGSQSDARCVP